MPWPTDGISYGGDYDPEQWLREAGTRTCASRTRQGVSFVTLGVFAWGTVETADGRVGDCRSYLFLLNHTDAERKAAANGFDLLGSEAVGPVVRLPAGGVPRAA